MSEHVLDPAGVTREPLAGEVALDPATGRPAGRAQALVLLFASCLAVLGAVLLAPVLPRVQDAFAGTPGVETLTPVVLTAPALVIGLTAMVAGRIVDRVGRKRLLVRTSPSVAACTPSAMGRAEKRGPSGWEPRWSGSPG